MSRARHKLRNLLHPLVWPPRRAVGLVVVAALCWRVARWGAGFPLWGDEAFVAVNFLTRGYGDMTRGLDHAQVVPLGFLWTVLALTEVLGTSELVMRLLPTLAGVASLVVLWRWAPRALPRREAWLGIAIFAASYYPVRHANEVKPYAVDLAVALGLTVLGWWCGQRPGDAKRWAVFALTAAVGIWFSYPSAFVVSGLLLALAWRVARDVEARRSVVPWVGGCVAGVLFVVSAVWMWRVVGAGQSVANESLRASGHWALAFPPSAGETVGQWLLWPVRLVWWFLEVHTGNMLAYPVGGKNAGSSLTFLLVVAGVVVLWRRRHPMLPLLLLPAGVCLAAAALRLYPYGASARTTQFLAPAVCLLAGVGGVALLGRLCRPRGAVKGVRIATLVMLAIILAGAARDVREPYKDRSDLTARSTLRALGDDAVAGERWVVVGSLRDTPWAPNMIGWGGSAARTRHYIIEQARRHGVGLHFAPDPDTLRPATGPTVLIVYRDNKHGEENGDESGGDDEHAGGFPAEQVRAYLNAAERRLGPPRHVRERSMEDGGETLWFYSYAPSGR